MTSKDAMLRLGKRLIGRRDAVCEASQRRAREIPIRIGDKRGRG